MNPIIGAGALISAALYWVLIFVAAVIDHAWIARDLAIATAGVTNLAYLFQWGAARHLPVGHALSWASLAFGAAAGLALLIGY